MTDDDRLGPGHDPDDRDPEAPDSRGQSELDLAFAGIVAGLDLELPDDADLDDPTDAPREPPRGPGTFEELRAWVDVDPGLLDATDDEDDDEEDRALDVDEPHYVPPPPPPAPTGDAVARWAWAGAVGAPVLYVGLSLVGLDTGGPLGWGLIAAGVAGFVTLVVRMKDGPRTDDGPDDGAVV